MQDLNPRSSTLEADALPTVLNSQVFGFCVLDGSNVPVQGTVCQLLGFAVHLVDAAAGAVFVEFQAIWMLALVLGGRIGALFAFAASERHDDAGFICHGWLLR